METLRVTMYCQVQDYIQIIIMEDLYRQDVLPRPRVYTDHHHGDTNGQDVLPRPRVYRDHGDTDKVRGLLEKYPTFGREKETGLLGALDT